MDMRRLFIVRTSFSSPNQREKTEQVDAQTEKITLKWTPEVRKAIVEVRNQHLGLIKKPALNFYGLLVIRERDKEEIIRIAEDANQAMRVVNQELRAIVQFIPLYLDDQVKGEVYQQVLGAIQSRIYSELFGRLSQIANLDEVPKRSRNALIKLVDRLQRWNVVDDPDVDKTLNEVKLSFETEVFKPVLNDLKEQLLALKARGAFLEFEDEPVNADA